GFPISKPADGERVRCIPTIELVSFLVPRLAFRRPRIVLPSRRVNPGGHSRERLFVVHVINCGEIPGGGVPSGSPRLVISNAREFADLLQITCGHSLSGAPGTRQDDRCGAHLGAGLVSNWFSVACVAS